jgi:hypothetical protein
MLAGVLTWLEDMAAQLADHVSLSSYPGNYFLVAHLLRTWFNLALVWNDRDKTPPSALMMVQPGVLRLVQRLALQPPPASRAAAAEHRSFSTYTVLLSCLPVITNCSGAVVDLGWHPAARSFASRTYIDSSRSSRGSSSSTTASSSSSSSLMGPSVEQYALVTGEEVGV